MKKTQKNNTKKQHRKGQLLKSHQDINSTKKPKKEIKTLHLGNMAGLKKSLSRLANMALQPDSDTSRIRTVVYVLNCLVATYRIDFEERLEILERIVNDKK
jgi:hypothetical protein